jgi:hypothetical protein
MGCFYTTAQSHLSWRQYAIFAAVSNQHFKLIFWKLEEDCWRVSRKENTIIMRLEIKKATSKRLFSCIVDRMSTLNEWTDDETCIGINIQIFLRRKVPGQTGARTHDLRQHRLALNTNALTLWSRSPFYVAYSYDVMVLISMENVWTLIRTEVI